MPLQHEIYARIHIAGQRIHRAGHLLAGGYHRAEPLLERLLQIAQPRKTERLDSANDGRIRGVKQRRDLHRRLLHDRFTIFIDIARHQQQPWRELVRPRTEAVTVHIDFAVHRDASGSGRPAICDCTCATIRPNEANEFEMASSREMST